MSVAVCIVAKASGCGVAQIWIWIFKWRGMKAQVGTDLESLM